MVTYEKITGLELTNLSDTLCLQRWGRSVSSHDLIEGMFEALTMLEGTREAALRTNVRRDLMVWRFFAREVQTIADALRADHGYVVTLPLFATDVPDYIGASVA